MPARSSLTRILFVLSSLMSLSATSLAAEAPKYSEAIAPIFNKYCAGCHNADDHEGGLVLASFESLGKGGENGPVLVAGKPDESKLLLVLTGKAEPAMPPEGSEAPTPQEIETLRQWIGAGAPGPQPGDQMPAELVTPKIEVRVATPAAIYAAAWSPDGKQLALGTYREVRLVDAESRALTRRLAAPAGNVTDVAFSLDGKQVFAAGGEPGLFGEVVVSDAATGQPIRSFKGHKDSLYALALSNDGKLLATGSYDQQIVLWNVETGEQLGTLAGHSGAVFDLAFSPDAKLLASASADRTVKLWDVASRARLDTFAQATQELYSVAFRPDGKQVVAGGADNRIRLWEISESAQEGTNPLRISKFAHQAPIIKLAYSPDGKQLASVAEDRTLQLFAAGDLAELRSLEAQPDWAPAVAFAPDSKRLFVGRADGSFALYDATNGEPVPPAKPELASIEPRAAQRGTPTRITLVGKSLLGASAVEFNSDKLSASLLPGEAGEAGDRVVIELHSAVDTPRGSYDVQIVTPGGKSKAVSLAIDDIPQLAEAEPNQTIAEAQTASLPATYWGALATPGDVDHFTFQANAGATIVFELAAKQLKSKLNGVLTLLDARGAVIATNNDFEGQDPLLAHAFAENGTYTIRVSDLAQAGSGEHLYRLSLGQFPYVTACYPLSVPAGQETSVELVGFNLPEQHSVQLPAGAAGTEHPVPIDANVFRVARPLKVLVGHLPESLEAEPNDQPASATVASAPVTMSGRIRAASEGQADVDVFRFASPKGKTWIIETEASRRESPVDTRIEVLDAEGRPVERLRLQALRNSVINFRNINSQIPDVRVDNWEEMELNEFLYMGGEVCRIFRLPQGPDSGFLFYTQNGARRCYFDTSGTAHAVGDACYIVEPVPAGSPALSNGLPVFPVYYANDDDGGRRLGRDSQLVFTAPADGEYLVRVSDVRSLGGDHFVYRLSIREPRPDFAISVGGANPSVPAGGGRMITITADRSDGFDEEIRLDLSGAPPGFAISSPIVIQAGHSSASAVITAAADAPRPTVENAKSAQVVATATINGSPVEKPAASLGEIKLAEAGKVSVRIEPAELTLAPGGRVTARLIVTRNGYDGRVRFDVQNLPHGVIVDNIGLNGVLIPEGQNEREVFLTARDWVPETTRSFFALTQEPGGEASPPAILHVRRPATVAQAESEGNAPTGQ